VAKPLGRLEKKVIMVDNITALPSWSTPSQVHMIWFTQTHKQHTHQVCMLNTQALSVHVAPHTHTSSVSHQKGQAGAVDQGCKRAPYKTFSEPNPSYLFIHRQAAVVSSSRTAKNTKNRWTARAVSSIHNHQKLNQDFKLARRSRASKRPPEAKPLHQHSFSRSWSEVYHTKAWARSYLAHN
jgi:hypothetical protein